MAGLNRVEINGQLLLDLTEDTVTASSLRTGVTAHDANGDQITGTGGAITEIDDTAGSGDYDKVWSAGKNYDEMTNVLQNKGDVIIENVSGSIASFDDGGDDILVKSLEVNIEPVQDLHGYSNPWPAGGGKNILTTQYAHWNSSAAEQAGVTLTLQSDGGIKLVGTASAEARITLDFNSLVLKAGNKYTLSMSGASSGIRWISTATNSTSGFDYTSQYGNFTKTYTIVSDASPQYMFIDVQSGAVVDNIIYIQIELGSSATSYAPFENICPISGHSEMNLYRTAANLWDEEWELGSYNSSGAKSSSTTSICCKNPIPVKPGTTYYFKSPRSQAPWFYDENGVFVSRSGSYFNNTTFTIPAGCYYMTFALPATYGTTYNHDISINYPATDTDYHAYNGVSVTIDLGQSVYVGNLNVLTGELTVTHEKVTYNGSESWYAVASGVTGKYQIRTTSLSGYKQITSGAVVANLISDYYPTKTPNQVYSASLGITTPQNSSQVYIYDPNFDQSDSASAFKTYLSSHNLTVVYELADPVTVQLTPETLSTILGHNNIWSDTGNVNIEYCADTGLYINKKIAELQALILEN